MLMSASFYFLFGYVIDKHLLRMQRHPARICGVFYLAFVLCTNIFCLIVGMSIESMSRSVVKLLFVFVYIFFTA